MLILIAVLGLVVGSFLNVLIFRIHAGKQFTQGRSECPHCHKVLHWYELIPVLSWLVQRGRCRGCGKPISVQYPLVELLTSLAFILTLFTVLPYSLVTWAIYVAWIYVICSLIVLAVYDIRWYLLPDKLLIPLIPAALLILGLHIAAGAPISTLWGPLEAAVLFGGGFYALAAVSGGRWMGGGDIKLAFVMGLLLGLQKTSVAMFIAFVAASVVGLLLISLKIKKRSDHIPFGPFLIGGTVIAFWYGTQIIDWYLHLNGL